MANTILEYDAKVDSKKRITLRNTMFDYYHVKSLKNGNIELSPRILVDTNVDVDKLKKLIVKTRQKAVKNGTANMTLADINKEIYNYE